MDALQTEIARVLAARAMSGRRATYQQVGEIVGWAHPTGRGLGRHLEVVLQELADRGLPPLTTILVPKGQTRPSEDAMVWIRGVLGDINIEAAQRSVFDFDWSTVPDLAPATDALPVARPVWLTSFWGFDPARWGCIGFADEARRIRFLRGSQPGVLVAIYVTKGRGPEDMRGQVVGILEISHETGHASAFLSGDRWAQKENDPEARGKWLFALRATRAWRVVPEDYRPVHELLPAAYASADPQLIGSNGVPVSPEEAERLFQLEVYEVEVYGQTEPVNASIMTLEAAVSQTRGGPIATRGYEVGETDGPRHLYILKLEGDIAAWLGRTPAEVDGRWIIKVGLSKSPMSRRDQIQGSWPRGVFQWSVFRPKDPMEPAPYANGAVALKGEDAMKARLVNEGAEWLGGEYYLTEEWLVSSAWTAGRVEAEAAQAAFEASNVTMQTN